MEAIRKMWGIIKRMGRRVRGAFSVVRRQVRRGSKYVRQAVEVLARLHIPRLGKLTQALGYILNALDVVDEKVEDAVALLEKALAELKEVLDRIDVAEGEFRGVAPQLFRGAWTLYVRAREALIKIKERL